MNFRGMNNVFTSKRFSKYFAQSSITENVDFDDIRPHAPDTIDEDKCKNENNFEEQPIDPNRSPLGKIAVMIENGKENDTRVNQIESGDIYDIDESDRKNKSKVLSSGTSKLIISELRNDERPVLPSRNSSISSHSSYQEMELGAFMLEEMLTRNDILFSRVRHNRFEFVCNALKLGISPVIVDVNGNTLLHICCQNNLKKMASLVITAGCPINVENKKGFTSLDYCFVYSFFDLADWLKDLGALRGITQLKN